MRLEGPVLFDGWVTKVLHLLQHGSHESGTQLFCISAHPCLFFSEIFSYSHVEVEGRKFIKETTTTFHVPVCAQGFF